jgi:microcystin-dependent protein
MACTNCFNGCAETVSDQCVKYTGIDVPALGISTGDSLLSVENAITNFLVPAINGTGIKPIIDPTIICNIVKSYLPACTTCTGFTLNEMLTAIVKTVCDLQEQIDDIDATLVTLNADYTIGCLTGVTASSDTHDIVQAIITKLCSVDSSVSTIVDELSLYVTRSEFCTLLEQCTSSNPAVTLASDKMLPYAVIPYYGPISGYPTAGDEFGATGAGIGYWARVFMCNGDNGTPDLRGRVPVGATNTPSTNIFPAQTNPATPGNPIYTYGLTPGANTVRLELPQIPAHNHTGSTAITIINPASHNHTGTATGPYAGTPVGGGFDGGDNLFRATPFVTDATSLTATTTLTILAEGQNQFHPNVQPGLALYYIQYRPV